jgi:RsiW-degrading membrane proteinase PrsW (M82 family)
MDQLSVTIYGQTRVFDAGHVVTVGSDPRSGIVLGDPAVAGSHLVATAEQGRWLAHDRSGGRTYVNGQPVSMLALDRPVTLRLGGPTGPDIALAPVAPAAPFRAAPVAGATVQSAANSVAGRLSSLWQSAPSFSVLLPVKSWWEGKDWRKGYPLFFILFALAPYVISVSTASDTNVKTIAWAYVGLFSVLWALLFYTLIKPGKLDAGLFAAVAGSSAICGIPLAIWLEDKLQGHDTLLHFIFGVGLPEELSKAAPIFVLMVLMGKGRAYSTRMFMYMGAVSGLAFGAVEGVRYVELYTHFAVAGQLTAAGFVSNVTWRFLTDSLFHGCTAIITAYFIGLAVKNPRWRVQLIGFGLGIMSVLHGVNDRWAGGWPWVGISAALLFVVIGYVQNGDRIEAQVADAARVAGPASGPTGLVLPHQVQQAS